mmetsp:Transcript_21419/g.38360  ORF Transcript_21419/g.38360 Transcript_21419/m.38360 type:complete len:113 (-) Transcript_21419:282-620(-)
MENANMTHGRYGALNVNTPRKDMRMSSLRRPQTYTIMKERELPRKCTETKGATAVMKVTPNRIIITKWAVRPRKSPSSSMRQYRTKKYMWNKKSIENIPKNKYVVINLHNCP